MGVIDGRQIEAGWYVARRQVRDRARAMALLALLVTVVVVAVLACGTASRRAGTALERLRDASRASDETLVVPDLDLAHRVTELPVVEDSALLVLQWMFPQEEIDAFLPVVGDPSGRWLRDLDRVDVIAGALPRLDDPEAVVMTDATADLLDVDVGDTVPVRSLDAEQAEAAATSGEFPETYDGPQPPLRVAAIVSLPPTNDDRSGTLLSLVTPAFLERYDGRIPTFGALVQVRLRPGATVAELSAELEALPGGDMVERDAAGTGGMDAAGSALDTVALGLAAMAVVAAIAGFVVIGQAVTRLLMSGADDLPVLSAMGLSPRASVAAMSVAPVLAVVAGVAVGAAIAPMVAPRLVGDFARRVDPDPGVFYDWVGLGTGGALALIALVALTVVAAFLAARRRGDPRSTRRSSSASVAAAAGLSSPVVAGLAIGFSRTGRRVPTRQALVSVSVGVVGLVAVAVFGASLDRILEQPERYGGDWDASVAAEGHDEPVELDRRGVTDAAVVSYQVSARLDGVPIPGMSIDPVRGRIDPVIVRGEAPVDEQDVLVGERTLDDLDLDIGDHAELRGPEGELEVRIVGTSAFIAPDDPMPLARGVLIHPTVLTDLGLDEGDSYRQLAVEVDGDARRAFDDLAEGDEVIYPHAPVEVSRLDDVRGFPTLLAAFLAVLAALGVGQLAFVLTRRRRRDLATLRALGFTRRQVRRAVFAQSGVVVAAGLILGLPIGLVLGRLTWQMLTTSIGLPFDPAVPVGLVAAVVALVVVAALLASTPGALASSRIRLAVALRVE
jgi:putative ABC transport system permease protein